MSERSPSEADLSRAFAANAQRLRLQAQEKYAEFTFAELHAIASGATEATPVRIRALETLQDQVLGRPATAAIVPASENQDVITIIRQNGQRIREKLARNGDFPESGTVVESD